MLNDNDTLDIVINFNDDVTFTFSITSDITSTSWPDVVGTMHKVQNCKYCIWTRRQSEVLTTLFLSHSFLEFLVEASWLRER